MFSADKPIGKRKEDKLGRYSLAVRIAEMIRVLPGSDSVVLGIEGAWGSGKTSLINLIKGELNDELKVIDFNPWFFGDETSLIQSFFEELSEETENVGIKIAKDLFGYGRRLVGGLQVGLPLGASVAIPSLDGATASISSLRKKIVKAMGKLDHKILVVVDDIDRLKGDEVRAVFKLVKLTANFPNTVFILAYDRLRVQQQLTDESFEGSEYLKKIVQLSFALPDADRQDLNDMITGELDIILKEIYGNDFPLDEKHWREFVYAGFFDSFKNIRDINGFMASLRLSWSLVSVADINIVDFIGVHAIRTFAPAFYRELAANKAFFTGRDNSFLRTSGKDEMKRTEQYNKILELVDNDKTRQMIDSISRALFPRLSNMSYGSDWDDEWRKERRVCSEDKFDFYFKLAVPVGAVSETDIQGFLASSDSIKNVRSALQKLAKDKKAKKLLQRLTDYAKNFGVENTVRLIVGIWSMEDDVKIDRDGVLDFNDFETLATRIAYWFIKENIEQEHRASFIQTIIETTDNLYQATVFVYLLDREHSTEEKKRDPLISDVVLLEPLKKIVADKIMDRAAKGTLHKEKRGAFMLYRWRDWGNEQKLKAYVSKSVRNVKDLSHFLGMFVSMVYSSEKNYKSIAVKEIGEFTDSETLKGVIKSASKKQMQSLSSEEKETIALFLNPPKNSPLD